jgi:hypothetical protein
VTVLALFGAVFLLLILLLTIGLARVLRRGKKMIREGRFPVQMCIVCQRPISAPDQAVGVLASAIPGVIAGLPPMVRRTAEATPTRFFSRTCPARTRTPSMPLIASRSTPTSRTRRVTSRRAHLHPCRHGGYPAGRSGDGAGSFLRGVPEVRRHLAGRLANRLIRAGTRLS